MRLPVLAPSLAALVLAATAHAEVTLPQRQPGLWELVMVHAKGGKDMTMRQCTDATTDKLFMKMGMGDLCKKLEVQQQDGGYTVDSDCTFGTLHTIGRAVVTGDFQTAYKMLVYTTTTGTTLPKEPSMTVNATRLGDCEPGQKPGDVIMPGGKTMNLLEMKGMTGQ